MLRHLIQFVLQLVALDIELQHILLDILNLLLLVGGLGEFGVCLRASLRASPVFVKAALKGASHHLRHAVAFQLVKKRSTCLVLRLQSQNCLLKSLACNVLTFLAPQPPS